MKNISQLITTYFMTLISGYLFLDFIINDTPSTHFLISIMLLIVFIYFLLLTLVLVYKYVLQFVYKTKRKKYKRTQTQTTVKIELQNKTNTFQICFTALDFNTAYNSAIKYITDNDLKQVTLTTVE